MRWSSELRLENESKQCKIAGPFLFLCSQITKHWLLFARVVLPSGLFENKIMVQWKYSHLQIFGMSDTRIKAKQKKKKEVNFTVFHFTLECAIFTVSHIYLHILCILCWHLVVCQILLDWHWLPDAGTIHVRLPVTHHWLAARYFCQIFCC